MKTNEQMIIAAQVGGFFVGLLGFLLLLFVLVIFSPDLSPTTEKTVASMLTVLGTILTGMVAYFFSRQRTDAPNPSPQPEVKP
jgi:hypothetical protein